MPTDDEMHAPQPSKPEVATRSESQGKTAAFSRADRVVAAFIVAVIFGLTGIGLFGVPGTPLVQMSADTDQISEQQARDRARAFNAATPLALRIVAPSEMQQALATMNLSDTDKQVLLKELGVAAPAQPQVAGKKSPPSSTSAPSAPSIPNPGSLASASNTAAPSAAATGTPSPAQQPQVAAVAKRPFRLAWVTLWDTDAEDGDMVRIDSSGFSTVVTLTNAPITFAVPVPEQGVINITGVRDGGGGITIGAMSGMQRIALPIMSVGQVLGVPVVAR